MIVNRYTIILENLHSQNKLFFFSINKECKASCVKGGKGPEFLRFHLRVEREKGDGNWQSAREWHRGRKERRKRKIIGESFLREYLWERKVMEKFYFLLWLAVSSYHTLWLSLGLCYNRTLFRNRFPHGGILALDVPCCYSVSVLQRTPTPSTSWRTRHPFRNPGDEVCCSL